MMMDTAVEPRHTMQSCAVCCSS